MDSSEDTAVDLSGRRLTAIPQEILRKCDDIRSLNLSKNQGILLQNSLKQFKHLRKLELRSCDLRVIPEDIWKLTELEDLSIGSNGFIADLGDEIRKLSRLRKLDLSGCRLATFPRAIIKLEQLEDLSIGSNGFIAGLSNEIGKLGRLRKLDISKCRLTSFPSFILKLEQLKELVLSGNHFLAGLNPAIGQLNQLEKLDIASCGLKSLPDCIGSLKQLKELVLSYNDFSAGLNPTIGLLIQLEKLDLRLCNLRSLPDSIGSLKQLKELDLSYNDFSAGLNQAIGQLNQLEKLDIARCGLQSLPDSIGSLKQLKELVLWDNDFSAGLNPAIGQLNQLEKLFLRECKLRSLPDSTGSLKQLRELHLSGNCLTEYPSCTLRLEHLVHLDLSCPRPDDQISKSAAAASPCVARQRPSVWKRFLNSLKKLRSLFSADAKSQETAILFGHNNIKQLPVELAYTNLWKLELDGNPITDPPEEIWTQGMDAIKSYMRAVIPGGMLKLADTMNMIGETGAGKSSVAQSLVNRSPCPTAGADRTQVMERLQMIIDESAGHSVNINDFGGHEIYHSILPIFLPANGLVILVFDLTDKEWTESVRKWLLTTIAKSREIRVIIVGTHADGIPTDERQKAEEQVTDIVTDVVRSAIEEVKAHIYHLQLQHENQNVLDKWRNLHSLCTNLEQAAIQVVTLNCLVSDDGLAKLSNLVVKSLRPLAILPLHWCRVMNDIANQSVDCLYITKQQVDDICRWHFTADDDNQAQVTILRYLSMTSQILWLEDHPMLRNFIFHSPQKVIETCKKVLHHDSEVHLNSRLLYSSELGDYENGILTESHLLALLSVSTQCVKQSEETVLQGIQHAKEPDVFVNLLQQFNLISYVTTQLGVKQFMVPCKLKPAAPALLQEVQKLGASCLNRVIVRLKFAGSVIPMSLFETNLSSIMTVASELATQHVCLEVWRDGIIILHDGVYFIAERRDSVITLTASSKPENQSPWIVLHPVLKRLGDNVTGSWHGVPPHCSVVCPYCTRRAMSDDRVMPTKSCEVGEVQTTLTTLTDIYRQDVHRRMCKKCLQVIPLRLCFPKAEAGTFTNDQRELEEFFKTVDVANVDISLQEKLRRIRPEFGRAILLEHAKLLAEYMYSKGYLNNDDRLFITRQSGDWEARNALFSFVEAGGDNVIRCLAEGLRYYDKKELADKLCQN